MVRHSSHLFGNFAAPFSKRALRRISTTRTFSVLPRPGCALFAGLCAGVECFGREGAARRLGGDAKPTRCECSQNRAAAPQKYFTFLRNSANCRERNPDGARELRIYQSPDRHLVSAALLPWASRSAAMLLDLLGSGKGPEGKKARKMSSTSAGSTCIPERNTARLYRLC